MPEVNDHDLLIELRTEMQNVRADIKDLKDGTAFRISTLEKDKADKKDVEELQSKINNNIEKRVFALENRNSNYKLAFTLYSLAVGSMILLILYHIAQTK
jgi:signal-transduction protein with cAMP-binding, CBS, and nucleotidyltransferase domain